MPHHSDQTEEWIPFKHLTLMFQIYILMLHLGMLLYIMEFLEWLEMMVLTKEREEGEEGERED